MLFNFFMVHENISPLLWKEIVNGYFIFHIIDGHNFVWFTFCVFKVLGTFLYVKAKMNEKTWVNLEKDMALLEEKLA